MFRAPVGVFALLFLGACGGSPPAGPTPPTSTVPAPATETFTSTVLVFLDWDRDGVMGPSERPLPGVEVQIAEGRGATDGSGRAVVAGVARGTFPVRFGAATLPPFLAALRETTVTAPGAGETLVPLAYPIGTNTPGLYMAFGDSISAGDYSTDLSGYRARLGRKLNDHYGQPIGVSYGGIGGGRTGVGVDLVEGALRQHRPAFTLIQWGVNDWAQGACPPETCDALPNLRQIIRAVKASNSLPCIATLTPSNTGVDMRAPPERNEWVKAMNAQIKLLAPQEGALLVDLYGAFERTGRLSTYMSDHVHPNDAGYEIIAETYFQALTRPRGASGVSLPLPLLLERP